MAPISDAGTRGVNPKYESQISECKAVIACDGNGHGCVLWYKGQLLEIEIQEGGLVDLGDLGLDDAPEGISIWEGTVVITRCGYEYPNEVDSSLEGKFRPPNAEEWAAIQRNETPWSLNETGEFISDKGEKVMLEFVNTLCPTLGCKGLLEDKQSVYTKSWYKECPECHSEFYQGVLREDVEAALGFNLTPRPLGGETSPPDR